jgi:hypothetical protein
MMGSGMLCLSSRSDITAAAAAAVTICKPYSLQTTSGYDSTARACMRAGIFITNDFLNEKRNCRKNDLSVVGEVCPRPEYQCWPVIGYRVSLSSLFFFSIFGNYTSYQYQYYETGFPIGYQIFG